MASPPLGDPVEAARTSLPAGAEVLFVTVTDFDGGPFWFEGETDVPGLSTLGLPDVACPLHLRLFLPICESSVAGGTVSAFIADGEGRPLNGTMGTSAAAGGRFPLVVEARLEPHSGGVYKVRVDGSGCRAGLSAEPGRYHATFCAVTG